MLVLRPSIGEIPGIRRCRILMFMWSLGGPSNDGGPKNPNMPAGGNEAINKTIVPKHGVAMVLYEDL